MIITANAKKYAKALFELAQEKQRVDEVQADFKNFLRLVNENADLKSFLTLPLDRERTKLISDVMKERFSELFFNFLFVVLKNKRFHLLEQIFSDLEKRIDAFHNRIAAVAITAFPLPKDKLAELTVEIAGSLNADVRLHNEVDPSILGGIILRVDGKLFNASFVEQFKKMKHYLIQNQK